MTAEPDVSVVIASYNCAAYLGDAIRSALGQTGVSVEIVVVDDCSTDKSFAIAQEFAAADPRVRAIQAEKNVGPAAARNLAISHAAGHWIAILDSDDLMQSSRLRTLVAEAGRAGADIVADDLKIFSGDPQAEGERLLPRRRREVFDITPSEFIESNAFYGGSTPFGYLKPVFRASALKSVGLSYDESLRIGEDYDLLARALLRGLKFRVIPQPTYLYRKHVSSISHRIRRSHIEALIEADDNLRRTETISGKEVDDALTRRRRSLRTALAFDDLVTAIKRGSLKDALSVAVRAPQAVPLLRLPLAAAIGRLVRCGKR